MNSVWSLTLVGIATLLVSCQNNDPPGPATPPAPQNLRPVAENPLEVASVVQEAPMSCWATCGEMIMGYVRKQSSDWKNIPAPRQCQQATNRYPEDCACGEQLEILCSKSGEPQFEACWNFSCQPEFRNPLT